MALSVVIPVYNEEDNVGPLLTSLRDVMDTLGRSYELIVVDDGSTDRTRARLRDLTSSCPRCAWSGYARTSGRPPPWPPASMARGGLVVTMDGDGQNDPADIPRLIDKLKDGYDVVSGWRHDRQDALWSRRVPSRIANGLISCITGVHLHDYGCALKVYRREILQDVALYGEMHRFLPALCHWVGATVGELPVGHFPAPAGRVQVRPGADGAGAAGSPDGQVPDELLDPSDPDLRAPRPRAGGVGLGLGAVLSYQKIVLWLGLANRPLLLLAVLLVLVGFQFVSMGLLGEMLVRTYHESQRKPIYTVREIISGGQS